MGIRFRWNVSPIEASIGDGNLYGHFFNDIVFTIPIDKFPKNISIPKQYNVVSTNMHSVAGFLKNDSFIIVVRFGGTVDILTDDKVLLARYNFDSSLIRQDILVIKAGSIVFKSMVSPLYLAKIDNTRYFLFSEELALNLLLDLSYDSCRMVVDWAMAHKDVGTMIVTDNGTAGTSFWINLGTSDYIKLKGVKILYSGGVTGGIE